jgi:hypothetical protein
MFSAGVWAALLACSLAGHAVSEVNPFPAFRRFHRCIGPETLYYPTASEVRAVARDQLRPDRIAVVVGGSSVLHGAGMSGDGLWTLRLQELLGERYRVVNLGMRGALPFEFGAVAAEMVLPEHDRLLFVTDTFPAASPGPLDGDKYRYFFWDAYYRGLLPASPARDRRVREFLKWSKPDEPRAELRLQARLDSLLRARDLWNYLGATTVNTVWALEIARHFTRPRNEWPDPGCSPDTLDVIYPPAARDGGMSWVRLAFRPGRGTDADLASLTCLDTPAPPGTARARIEQGVAECCPEGLRGRTLIVVMRGSPFYLDRLAPAEQRRYDRVCSGTVRTLEHLGFAALEVGRGYDVLDYADHCHFNDRGGSRLAAAVAARLRDLARQLGYER